MAVLAVPAMNCKSVEKCSLGDNWEVDFIPTCHCELCALLLWEPLLHFGLSHIKSGSFLTSASFVELLVSWKLNHASFIISVSVPFILLVIRKTARIYSVILIIVTALVWLRRDRSLQLNDSFRIPPIEQSRFVFFVVVFCDNDSHFQVDTHHYACIKWRA